LGRETPRGTIFGFLNAARSGKLDVAALYLNSNLKGKALTDLTNQLYVVLNSRLPVRLNVLSDRPEGSLMNPLTPDRDVVGAIPSSHGDLEIALERVNLRGGRHAWLFARSTLDGVPDVYGEVHLLRFDRYLPRFLTYRIAGVRVLEWLSISILLPLLYRLLGVLSWFIRPLVLHLRRRLGASADTTAVSVHGSIRLLLIAFLVRLLLRNFDLPLTERRVWAAVAGLLAITGMVWLALLCIDFGELYVQRRVRSMNIGESRALIRLGARIADVVAVALGGVALLYYFGFNPTAALAGLGIGGIAVALAAQKTLENVIGGFSIVFDKAVKVGDVVRVGTTVGTVDHVGLRSTRIRTLDRTIVIVPNGQIATADIEAISERDKFRFFHSVGVSYRTTAAQMRTVSAGLRELLVRDHRIEADSVRVQFIRLSPSSLDIEVVSYVHAAGYESFLVIQQELLIRMMEIIEEAGTEIAFPTQTLHVQNDSVAALTSVSSAAERVQRGG
jgi:MscS family membrane protein